mmetsp:Transcript_129225/g.359856  ORF Transcript_129225/g.359856 Transcript_129225/m.359856 type:complete len:250 (+) Transcript_129225:1602-2351(+)
MPQFGALLQECCLQHTAGTTRASRPTQLWSQRSVRLWPCPRRGPWHDRPTGMALWGRERPRRERSTAWLPAPKSSSAWFARVPRGSRRRRTRGGTPWSLPMGPWRWLSTSTLHALLASAAIVLIGERQSPTWRMRQPLAAPQTPSRSCKLWSKRHQWRSPDWRQRHSTWRHYLRRRWTSLGGCRSAMRRCTVGSPPQTKPSTRRLAPMPPLVLLLMWAPSWHAACSRGALARGNAHKSVGKSTATPWRL